VRRREKAGPVVRLGWVAGVLVLASVGADRASSAAERRPVRPVFVVWVSAAEPCAVEPEAVFAEVRRVFRRTSLRVVWREASAESESGPDEIRIVGLRSDPAHHPHPPLGVTSRLADGVAWVVCSEVARTIGREERAPGPEMNVAVGRVVAHELVHVLFPEVRHTPGGLMAAVVDASTLTDTMVDLDGPLCRHLGRRLRKDAVAPSEPAAPSPAVGGGQD
jgi:hypothetical protein